MTIETQIYSILTSVFDGEIYPVVHPDPDGSEVADLFAIYLIVGGSIFQTIKKDSNLRRPRVQISIYGIDYDVVSLYSVNVISKMNESNLTSIESIKNNIDPLTISACLPNTLIGEPIDGYEKDTKRYVKHLEFYCWVRS